MIDLHSHILPGIDDGPKTLEQSLDLAVLYRNAGFTKVVATPHWVYGTSWTPSIELIHQRIALLRDSLESKQIGIQVYAGMEIALDVNLGDLLIDKHLLTLAGSPYVLIESPFQRLPLGWEQMFFTIMAKGYRIVLAHPERCLQLFSNPELYDEIIEAGVYFQVNYDSFLGHYGKKESEAAFDLLKKGYIHFLATDSHDPLQRHPGNVLKALKILEKTIDAKAIDMLTRINPEHLINGEPLEKTASIDFLPENRKRWRWF
jgi:protein-tyrosine phosphatase